MRPFFFHVTATTEFYTLSLHDALPICRRRRRRHVPRSRTARRRSDHSRSGVSAAERERCRPGPHARDRKSTRLNSSHMSISYAVFCLKKKNEPAVELKIISIYGNFHCL